MANNIQHKAGLFIGIGGSGIKSLSKLKANMYYLYKEADLASKFKEHQFIFIDTDSNDIRKSNEDNKLDGEPVINTSLGEFIDIGKTVPHDLRNSKNSFSVDKDEANHFFSWMITENDNPNFSLVNRNLSSGAAASRIDGRAGFYENYQTISNQVSSAISALSKIQQQDWNNPSKRADGVKETNFWVISGTNGGTGSSMTLDILFLLDRLFQDKVNGKPSIKLAILTPQPYIDLSKHTELIRLNSFASLWEINAFKTNRNFRFKEPNRSVDTNYFNCLFVNNDFIKKNVTYKNVDEPWDLFDYCIAFDTVSKDGNASIPISESFQNVADTISSLACLAAGSFIDSKMINTIQGWKLSDKSITTTTPRLIEGVKWGTYVAATSNKVLQKPISQLSDYVRARIKYEILNFGLIGKSFEYVYRNDIKNQYIVLQEILSKQILNDLTKNNISSSELKIDLNNLYSAIDNEFNKISNPDEIDIKEGTFLGVKTGYKKGDFQEIWDGIRQDLLYKVKLIKDIYSSDNGDLLSKKEILTRIKNKVEVCIDQLVVEYGYQYAYDIFYKFDTDIESEEGKKYLGELNLKSIEDKITKEYSDSKITSIQSSIESCIEENEDLETLKSLIKDYINFQKENLILQIKKDVLEILVKGRNGIFDQILISPTGERGLNNFLENLKKELNIAKLDFEKLAIVFGNANNPFKVFLPPLVTMVNGSQWKEGSEFDKVYISMLPRDQNGNKSNEYAFDPLRNGENSIADSLDKFRQWIISKKNLTLKNGCYFAECALNENFLFSKMLNEMFNYESKDFLGYYENQYVCEHPSVINWKNKTLKIEYYDILDSNKAGLNDMKVNFIENHVLYPTSRVKEGIEEMYIYSGGNDLKEIARDLGYDENNILHSWNETSDNSKLNKIVFEVGHTLGEYRYLSSVYAPYYEAKRQDILKFKFGCHVHKYFNHLNMDKTMREVVPGFQVDGFTEKVFAIHLTYYSALFDLMKTDEENKDILNLLFKPSVPNPFTKTSTETFPLLWMKDKNNVFYLRKLVLDSASKMLSGDGQETVTIQNARDYGDLMIKSLDNNAKFKDQVELLSQAFRENQSKIGTKIKAFIEANHDTIFLKAAEISNKSWDLEMDKKTMELITSQYNEIRISHVFQ
jgi:hypothetical protein